MIRHWFEFALLPNGWAKRVRITVDNGFISAIELGVAPGVGDERHGAAVPGLGNLHSHAFQRGMAGLTEGGGGASDSFWSWRAIMYRFLQQLSPDDVEAIAALAFAEMAESGFTRVGEFHYLHKDCDGLAYGNPGEMAERLASAASEVGIGLTLLPVYYAHADFGGVAPLESQRRFATSRDEYEQVLFASRNAIKPLAHGVVGIAPHSLRAVSPGELDWMLAANPEGPVHIHIAEQMREVDACLAWSGQRPIDWLYDHAQVDERWCLVHATHANEVEISRIAQSGAVVGLCPITEANLADGIFPVDAFLAQGGAIGVGSDSNVLIDAAEELRLLDYGQRLTSQARNQLATAELSSGRSLFDKVGFGGAQALGCNVGLREGASADFVTLNLDHPSLMGRQGDKLLDGWIYAAKRQSVDDVWIAGAKIVSGGVHRDKQRILNRYKLVVSKLIEGL
jgi:formimidoylglutamate deiminase